MAFIHTLRSALRRRSDHQIAQDIIEAGAPRPDSAAAITTATPHGSQGIRPFGFGY